MTPEPWPSASGALKQGDRARGQQLGRMITSALAPASPYTQHSTAPRNATIRDARARCPPANAGSGSARAPDRRPRSAVNARTMGHTSRVTAGPQDRFEHGRCDLLLRCDLPRYRGTRSRSRTGFVGAPSPARAGSRRARVGLSGVSTRFASSSTCGRGRLGILPNSVVTRAASPTWAHACLGRDRSCQVQLHRRWSRLPSQPRKSSRSAES
jgi:hypothetical protein